jgi:hypothetical protein
MKSGAVLCLTLILANISPAAGQSQAGAPLRIAQAATGSVPAQPQADAAPASTNTEPAAKPRRHKKTTSAEPARRSGAAIVKEGGKTCSGLDEYRVCW